MATLRDEVIGDPLDRDYVNKTDVQVNDSLRVKDRPIADHDRKTFRDLLRQEGMVTAGVIVAKLQAGAETDAGLVLLVEACSDYGGGGGLDFADEKTIEDIDAIVTGGVITSNEGDKLKVMGVRIVDRLTELGLRNSRVGHIGIARKPRPEQRPPRKDRGG